MISPKIFLGILVAVLLGGITLLVFEWWVLGSIVTVLSLVLLYLYWRLNQILGISQALTKNDLVGARTLIDKVKNPTKLNAYSKTYLYFFRGMVEVQTNNFKEARQAFRTSIDTNRFRSVDEKATALVMLAQLDLRNRNTEGAKRYLKDAKALEPSKQVREQIQGIVKQARLRL